MKKMTKYEFLEYKMDKIAEHMIELQDELATETEKEIEKLEE